MPTPRDRSLRELLEGKIAPNTHDLPPTSRTTLEGQNTALHAVIEIVARYEEAQAACAGDTANTVKLWHRGYIGGFEFAIRELTAALGGDVRAPQWPDDTFRQLLRMSSLGLTEAQVTGVALLVRERAEQWADHESRSRQDITSVAGRHVEATSLLTLAGADPADSHHPKSTGTDTLLDLTYRTAQPIVLPKKRG